MKHRLFAALLMLVVTLSVFVAPVLAHAELARSIPEANAALDRSPAQVELVFTEAVEPSFSTVTVLDSNGNRVDNGDARLDPGDLTRLTVSLPSLPDGVYTVSWRVLSTVDSHVTAGAFPFAVGDVESGALATAGSSGQQYSLALGEVLARWLIYISAAMLVGGPLFVLVVWQPAFRAVRTEFKIKLPLDQPIVSLRRAWRWLAAGALLVFILANVLALLTKAGQASGVEIAPPWSPAFASTLFNTRYGAVWIGRFAVTLAFGAVLLEANTKRARWLGFGLSLLLLLSISLGSHAATEAEPLLPVTADWLHLLSASAWIGGLTHFVASLWLARGLDPAPRTALTARLIPRFSALALTSVGVLTLSGVYSALLRVGTWEGLTNTLYGRVLIIKLLIALPMIALGAVNLLWVTPRMKRGAADPGGNPTLVTRFQRLISSEVSLAVMIFLSVGLFTSIPPARVAATNPSGLNFKTQADDLQIAFNVAPGRVGVNTFTVIATANGQAVINANAVRVRFTPTSGNLPPSEAQLVEQGDGQYSLKGSFLSLPDTWQAQVVVRRQGQFDAYANFEVPVGPAGQQGFAWHMLTGGLLFAAALAYLFVMSALSQTRAQQIGYGLLPTLGLAIVSVFVFYLQDIVPGTLPVNPIPPNAASIATGETLYQANCVACHGEGGKGDGPVGLTLSPRPADLTVHTAPGVHPDGQLYDWITNGFPGNNTMPAWRERLTNEERWHIVNYIRTLNTTP